MKLSPRPGKLVGESVELCRHKRENYPLYAEWYGDEEVWYLTSWAAEPPSPRSVERLFEERELSSTEDSFAIHLRDKRCPLGIIGLMNLSEANASADMSIIVGSQEDRDCGYGTEAILLLLRYAFEERKLHRIGLSVFEFNYHAIATYDKLGFVTEGKLRQAVRRSSKAYDAILMSILAPEWRRLYD